MRRLYTIFVLAILMLSILPEAFAQQSIQIIARGVNTVENGSDEAESAEKEIEPIRERTRLKERIENSLGIKANISERIEQARERYQRAKERYQAAKEKYQELRLKLKKTKDILAKCKEDTECINARVQIKTNSRDFLLNTADRVFGVLEKLRARIEANEQLAEEEKAGLLAEIDVKADEIENIRETISNLTNESTKEEIRAVAQQIKNVWIKTRAIMKRCTVMLVNEKIGGIITKSGQLEERLQKILDRLESQGYDINGIEDKLAEFSAKITKAKESYEKAKELYKSAVSPGEIDELMKEANRYIQEARQSLKEAHFILKDIVFSIKGLKNGQRILEAPEEAEEEIKDTEKEAEENTTIQSEE